MRDQLSRPLAAPHPTEAKLVPGYLLTPFGWAAQLLAGMVDAEPDLLAHVFELDRQRMHVIALALAHLDGNPPPQLGPVLLRGSARDLLHRVLGRSPVGIKRVLRRLPFAVLSQLSYRRLVQLLDNPQATKLLHHLPDAEITDSMIGVLYEVPAPLRAVALATRGLIHKLFPEGLRLLASRGAAPSFDLLVADLATRSQPGQFVARIKDLVASLPLPQTLPPAQIGIARRLDSTGEVCALANQWKNCLGERTVQIDAGECAIYLWDDPTAPAVCQVTRHGRLGWFLSEALGPRNIEPEPEQMQQIRSAFADAGIPASSVACAIDCILLDYAPRYRTRTRRQRRWLDRERRERDLHEEAWTQETLQPEPGKEIPVPPSSTPQGQQRAPAANARE